MTPGRLRHRGAAASAPLLVAALVSIGHPAHGRRPAPDGAEIRAACYFAYGLRLDLRDSSQHTLRGADFQRKVADFYAGLPAAAPLEEAYWVLSLPEHFQETITKECPALVILSYVLVAETKLYLEPESAAGYAATAASVFQQLDTRLQAMLLESWPIQQASDRYMAMERAVRQSQAVAPQGFSVDFVVAHCREDLSWMQAALSHWARSGSARVFVYEKCGEGAEPRFVDIGGGAIPSVHVAVADDGPAGRRDECSAFLTHLIRHSLEGNLAYYTVFLQGDAYNHVQMRHLDLVMRSVGLATLDVPFLHLSQARMVASSSPCKRAIFEQALGRTPAGMQVSYCCAHFMARWDSVLARGREAWERALSAMDTLPLSGCEAVRPATGMHCLAFEAMWHVFFGMPEKLPPRAEDVGLPVFLRMPEADGSDLPGGGKCELYLANAAGDPSRSAWVDEIDAAGVDVSGARSIGYMHATPGE